MDLQDNDPGLSIIAPVQDTTPLKFPYAHTLARFSGNGFLLRVLPNNPKEGVPALVELHEINALLSKLPESQETRLFPGELLTLDNLTASSLSHYFYRSVSGWPVSQARGDRILPAKDSPSYG